MMAATFRARLMQDPVFVEYATGTLKDPPLVGSDGCRRSIAADASYVNFDPRGVIPRRPLKNPVQSEMNSSRFFDLNQSCEISEKAA